MSNIVVESVKNYIVKVRGQYNYRFGQIFSINHQSLAILISADHEQGYLMVDSLVPSIKSGDPVFESSETFETLTRPSYFGNIINIHGKVIHGLKTKPFFERLETKPNLEKPYPYRAAIFNIAPTMKQRLNLNEPLLTGIFTIDLLIPLGKGQRQLILGNPKTGKTSIALSTILNQKDNELKIIYTCIGTKASDLKIIYNVLAEKGLMFKTIIVYAPSNNIFQQYLAPYVAMAHAENLAALGHEVLIVFDDLSNHANTIREAALLINKPVGKEAFPGDLFFQHSSLLERAGKFKNGSSITALPIIRILNDDVTSLLATNVISITDGQIVLNSDIQASGIYPAIDVNLSVSRTGSKVQNQILRRISSKMYKIYTLYKLNNRFDSSNYDFSDAISDIIKKGRSLFNVLKQDEFLIYPASFILLLSNIIEWRILEKKGAEDVKKLIVFLHFVTTKTFIGRIVLKTLYEEESLTIGAIFKSYIQQLIYQFEKRYQKLDFAYDYNYNLLLTESEWTNYENFVLQQEKAGSLKWVGK